MPPVSDTGPSSFRIPVSAVAIIPARYESSRLPGKALADIAGRPMIEHVYRRAAAAAAVSRVIVATDDRRIFDAVRGFGGEAVMTSASHQSGTDRLAEAAASLACDVVVNVQGDEPLLAPDTIDAAVAPFTCDSALEMSTLRRAITDPAELLNPNVTKVVVDRDGFAMYFSRAPIPFTRAGQPPAPAWAHIGLYVYRRSTLLRIAALPPTANERAEALEQLRALEHGIRIKAIETDRDTIGVDTRDDLERVRAMLAPITT
ncbi:MAG TPA: 3-deoxy-manno-octulosonate cytidylyltransferase [Vicinamibacterales bacterium]|nr:3-deoxy-manno-octulosonate cytidylyltransferase [Vicinamibacterales bacterium]